MLSGILTHLKNYRKCSHGYSSLCPAHDDKENSLSVREVEGKILLNCFAGCNTRDILAAVGLEWSDLFKDQLPLLQSEFSLAELVVNKHLPLDFVENLGWRNGNGIVEIPYLLEDGKPAPRYRIRKAIKGGWLWNKGQGEIVPYGLWLLEAARKERELVICEGETDAVTFWLHKIPALGVPGAQMIKTLLPQYFQDIDTVFIVQEYDKAGKTFAKNVRKFLSGFFQGKTRVVDMERSGKNDPNELHQASENFQEAWQELLEDSQRQYPSKIIEEEKRTWWIKRKPIKKGSEIIDWEEEKILVASFIIVILQEIINEEKRAIYKCKVQSPSKRQELEVPGEFMWGGAHKFRESFSANGFEVHDDFRLAYEDFKAHMKEKSSSWEIVKTSEKAGMVAPGIFLFDNVMATPDGLKPISGWLEKLEKIRHCGEYDLIPFFEKINKVLPGQAWKALGFATATLFSREIFERFYGFPILFLHGETQSGKTTIARIITALFGAVRAILPLNDATTVGIDRYLQKYACLPVTVNEYRGATKENLKIIAAFDRQGRVRGKRSNDLATWGGEIVASLIISSTRFVSGEKSDEVGNRLVVIDMNKRKPAKRVIEEITCDLELLADFVPQVMQKITWWEIEQEILDIRTKLFRSVDSAASDRIVENHAIFLACANILERKVANQEPTGDNLVGAVNDIREREKESYEFSIENEFLSILEGMIDREDLKSTQATVDRTSGIIYFNLNKCYPFIKKNFPQVPDKKTVIASLKKIGCEYTSSRNLGGTPRKIWVYDPEGVSKDE